VATTVGQLEHPSRSRCIGVNGNSVGDKPLPAAIVMVGLTTLRKD